MPRVGSTTTSGTYFSINGFNQSRLYAALLTMPEHGYITQTAMRMASNVNSDLRLRVRLAIWSGPARERKWNSAHISPAAQPTNSGGTEFSRSVPHVAVASGGEVFVGAWADDQAGEDYGQLYARSIPGLLRYPSGEPDSLPSTLEGTFSAPEGGSQPAAYFDYTPNSTPIAGAWEEPTGDLAPVSPTLRGTTPHPAADADYDYTSEVHLQVWRADTGTMAYDNLFATTQAEKDGGYYERNSSELGFTLLSGTTYRARYRHRDRFGVYSPFSSEIEFTTSEGPDEPGLQAPTGKINALGGYTYDALYTHPNGVDCAAWQVRVYNSTGSTLLYDSGEIAAVAADGSVLSMAEFHADLTWATSYKWRARVKDAGNSYSQWSAFADFKTDSPPDRPVPTYPINNQATQDLIFTASLSDPDGDPIQAAQIEIVSVSTNTVVTGYPKAMTVNAEGTQATFDATADLTYGDFKWRARGDDGLGPGYGEWSGYEFFKYAQVPTATFVFPRPRTNLVRDPSAEGSSAYWTETARSATDYIDKISDGDAAYGVSSWQGTADGAGNSLLGEAEAVEAGRAYLLTADMKKMSDEATPSASHLQLACYDGTGTRLADVYPDSIRAANGADIEIAWTRYGGLVWPEGSTSTPALPAGTATIRPEWVPSTVAATVRADAFSLEPVGQAAYPVATRDAEWHGYADPSLFSSGYSWSGTAHDSESSLLPVLTAPAPEVSITYSSETGLAKKDDRLLIERLDGTAWMRVLDTGYPVAGSDRTRIPVPGGYLKNEGRYRIKVMVRDTNDIAGETPWQTVDVRYDGPAEPLITVAQADSARAVLRGTFAPPDLTDVEFVAYEVLREAVDGSEPLEVVDVIPDPAATGFAYHFPASGKQYAISVRAVALVGSEQVEGRRSQAIMSVDYPGYYFVKDAEDPANLWVKYQVPRDALRSLSVEPPEAVYLPWGSRSPVVLTGEARPKEGALQIRLLGDLDGDSLQSRWTKIRQMEDRRRTICLLSHHPVTEKIFARFSGAAEYASHEPKKPLFVCGWREVYWPEDYYERTGERL